MYSVRHYVTGVGNDTFIEWLKRVRDPVAKLQVAKRVNRMELGNFGDHKFCRDGVWEIRVDVGAGYRVYYAQAGKTILVLLCGGDKRTQGADIDRAVKYWQDWQRRPDDER